MSSPAAWWARALEHQAHRDARAPGRTWDLRLVPAALGAWLTGLLGTRLSPAQAAARSSAASIPASRRGTSSIRPAEVRDVSSSTMICRSRSGRHVRTTRSERRAVARQSMLRTSSPGT